MSNTASLCQILDGRYTSWKISLKQWRNSRTNQATPWFSWSKAEMHWDGTTNKLKELVKETVQSVLHSKQTSWSTIRGTWWVQLRSWSSNWMEILPLNQTNNFVFVSALGAARRLELESQLGFLAIFNLDWTVVFFFYFSCSGSLFRLREIFNSLAIDGECEQIHLSYTTFFNLYTWVIESTGIVVSHKTVILHI